MAIKFLNTVAVDTDVLYVDASNDRVGIGTTSPSQKLHIDGTTSNTTGLVHTTTGLAIFRVATNNSDFALIGQGGSNRFDIYDNNAGSTRFSINSSGNVGIGTTSPSSKLDVSGRVLANAFRTADGSTDYSLLTRNSSNTAVYIQQAGSGNIVDFRYGSQNAGQGISAMLIGSTGNVGIGTINPQEELHIASTVPVIRLEDTDGGYAQIVGSNGSLSLRSDQANTVASSIIDFTIDNSEKMRITSAGNVGIGTTSPGSLLHIKGADPILTIQDTSTGTVSASSTLRLGESGAGGVLDVYWDIKQASDDLNTHLEINHSSNGNHFTILDSGNVGIGTTSPGQKLEVNGNVKLSETAATTDTDKFVVLDSGVLKYRTGAQVRSDIGAGTGTVGGSGTTNYIPKWSNSSTLTNSGIVETSTLTTINNDSFEYDHSGTTYLNIDGTTGTFLLGQHSTANRVYIHGIQSHLRFYTDNVKAAEFDSSQNFLVTNGNVGIGVTSPSAKLEVNGDIAVSGDNNVYSEGDTLTLMAGGTGGTYLMVNDASGGVGIGTTSPNHELDVVGSAQITNDIYLGRYIFHDGDTNTWLGFPTNDAISFRTNGSDRMYINSSGNVGIGTTNPGRNLHVAGAARVDSTFYLGTDDGCAFFRYYNALMITNSVNSTISLGGGPGSVNNNVFVGNGYLDVNGYIRGKNYLYLEDASGTLRTTLRSESTYATLDNGSNVLNYNASNHYFLVGLSEKMRINSSGNVGIGTTNPGEKLEVNGTIKASATTDAYKGYIKQNVNSYGAEKVESSNYYFTSYNTTTTVTSAQAYNRMVAAYNGRVKKVYIRHGGASTPTATAVNFKKHTNGTTSSTVYSATVANAASANMSAYYEFGNNDFTFNAGDLIGLLYQTTDAFGTASKTMGGVAVTITLEYNIT